MAWFRRMESIRREKENLQNALQETRNLLEKLRNEHDEILKIYNRNEEVIRLMRELFEEGKTEEEHEEIFKKIENLYV